MSTRPRSAASCWRSICIPIPVATLDRYVQALRVTELPQPFVESSGPWHIGRAGIQYADKRGFRFCWALAASGHAAAARPISVRNSRRLIAAPRGNAPSLAESLALLLKRTASEKGGAEVPRPDVRVGQKRKSRLLWRDVRGRDASYLAPPHRSVRAQFGHTACMGLCLSRRHHAISVVLCHSILLFDLRRKHSFVPTAYLHRRRAQRRSRTALL